MEGSAGRCPVSEQSPTRVYEKDKPAFERLRALPIEHLLREPVESLPLAARALSYCRKQKVSTIGQLAQLRRSALLKAKNVGRKTVSHMEAYLGFIGLGLDGKVAPMAPPMAPAYERGAHAMRLSIVAQLAALNVPFEIVQAISQLPMPKQENA